MSAKSKPKQRCEHEETIRVGRAQVRVRASTLPGTQVRVQVESVPAPREAAQEADSQPVVSDFQQAARLIGSGSSGLVRRLGNFTRRFWKQPPPLENLLFGAAILLYLLTRLWGITRYPIFFFTDEAVQTVLAQDLVRENWHGGDGVFLPTFFLNSYQYNLGTSVYLQVLPYMLFGKSILVTRGIAALATVIAALSVGLVLRQVFGSRRGWLAVLLLAVAPAWFLHSRTAFETALATSLYAGFLYFYLRYRTSNPHNLYWAVLFGGLTFYSYSPARMVILVTGLLLFLSDIGYHWQQRKVVLRGLALLLLMTLPMARFQILHPDENTQHLRVLNSYWVADMTLGQKLTTYAQQYLAGLNPLYWFQPNETDLVRHRMGNLPHLLGVTFPFTLLGIGLSLRHIRNAPHRALLLALVVAPSGAALVSLGITRSLIMVVPATVLAALGVDWLLEKLQQRFKIQAWLVSLPVFLLLAGGSLWLLRQALVAGPYWSSDYGLTGMQWGAPQVFREIDAFAAEEPDVDVLLSPSWANGTDNIVKFFYDQPPFHLGSIEGYLYEQGDLENLVFVMLPEELEMARETGKFESLTTLKIVPYLDGRPGFYFIRARYVDDIADVLAQEKAARQKLQNEHLIVNGQPAEVGYSYLDMGSIDKIFDDSDRSLIRTMEANPLQVVVVFDQPITVREVTARVGGTPTRVTVSLRDRQGELLATSTQEVASEPTPRDVTLKFDQPYETREVWLEVLSVNDGEPAHVHLWEVMIR
ncbi:MAG: hypothetical protein HPY76_01765 [Anaerolineae bacterium]|nr:hypothetical protein [Anaerolineae bacterium]